MASTTYLLNALILNNVANTLSYYLDLFICTLFVKSKKYIEYLAVYKFLMAMGFKIDLH